MTSYFQTINVLRLRNTPRLPTFSATAPNGHGSKAHTREPPIQSLLKKGLKMGGAPKTPKWDPQNGFEPWPYLWPKKNTPDSQKPQNGTPETVFTTWRRQGSEAWAVMSLKSVPLFRTSRPSDSLGFTRRWAGWGGFGGEGVAGHPRKPTGRWAKKTHGSLAILEPSGSNHLLKQSKMCIYIYICIWSPPPPQDPHLG